MRPTPAPAVYDAAGLASVQRWSLAKARWYLRRLFEERHPGVTRVPHPGGWRYEVESALVHDDALPPPALLRGALAA